jgi:hypothetical protein
MTDKIVKTDQEHIIFLRGFKKYELNPNLINLEKYFENLQHWCRSIETDKKDVSIICTLLDNGGTLYDCDDERFFQENPLERSEENVYILLVINGLELKNVHELTQHRLFQLYFKYIEVRPAETIYY